MHGENNEDRATDKGIISQPFELAVFISQDSVVMPKAFDVLAFNCHET